MSSTVFYATPVHTPSHSRSPSDYVAMRTRKYGAADHCFSPCRAGHISATPPRKPFMMTSLDSPMLLLTPSPLRRQINMANDSPMHLDFDPYALVTPFKPSADSSTRATFTSQSPAMFCRPPETQDDDEGVFFESSTKPSRKSASTPERPTASPLSHKASNVNSAVPHAPKRKVNVLSSSPQAKHLLTPLRIHHECGGDGHRQRLPSLAPLPPPGFWRTPVDPEHHLKGQAESMRKMRIGDKPIEVDSSDDESGGKLQANKSTSTSLFPSKSTNEVADAISPGGHVSKRRAKSRPTSLDMSGSLSEMSFAVRLNPFAKGHSRKKSNTSVSDAGSPMRVTRASPRPAANRVVSSATLFFGPAITNTLKDDGTLKPQRPALVTRSSTHTLPPGTPSPLTSPSDDEQDPFCTNSANTSFTSAFAGPADTSFNFSVTNGSPRAFSPGRRIPKKYKKPRDSGIVVSDDEGNSSFMLPSQFGSSLMPPDFQPHTRASTQPNPSTSCSSVLSGVTLLDESLTPGNDPSPGSAWPIGNAKENIDEFIVKTLTAGGKDRESLGAHKKMPNTPQKRTRTAFLGVPPGQRPWASAVTTKVTSQMALFGEKISGPKFNAKGVGEDDDEMLQAGSKKGVVNKPRRTCPGALQFPPSIRKPSQEKAGECLSAKSNGSSSEFEASPSNTRAGGSSRGFRPRTYGDVGLGKPRNSLKAQGLLRRSSSGAFSNSSDGSALGTPTRSNDHDWRLAAMALKQQYTPATNLALSPISPDPSPLADSPTAGLGHQAAVVGRKTSFSTGSSSNIPVRVQGTSYRQFSTVSGELPFDRHDAPHMRPRPRNSGIDVRGVWRHSRFSAPHRASSEYEQPGRFEKDFDEVDDIGSGEFGNAIKVRYKQGGDGEVFAVKKSKRFEGVRHRIRLREEVDVLRHLSVVAGGHPNVLAYVDSWEQDEALYILTELCDFGNFAHFLTEYGHHFARLDEGRVWKIMAELSSGLQFIHASGVIHLDFKPANIFITASGRFRIGDFGMASIWPRPPRFEENANERGAFEREGDKMYLAAEVLQGRYGKEADIFSFGMTMLETAANIVVPTQGELWHRLREEDFGPVDGFEGESSDTLVDLIRSMMRTDPARRPSAETIFGHRVVAMARSKMAEAGRGVGDNEALFRASPLAGEEPRFLQRLLGEAPMDVC